MSTGKQARVDIITRTKDRPVLLERALRSVAGQDFSDYLHIIVNDAGDPQVVADLVAALPEAAQSRTKIVHNQVSAGREAALQAGLDAGQAEYFAIHDDDDSWEPGFLQATVAYLDAHPDQAGVATHCYMVHEELNEQGVRFINRGVLAPELEHFSFLETMIENYIPPIAQLFRRQAGAELGFWDGSIEVQADWDFNLKLLARGQLGFIAGEPLASWHHRLNADARSLNSVVSAAAEHRLVNIDIRDRYLRQAFQEGHSQALAQALVSTEMFKRTQREFKAQREELESLRLQVVHLTHLVQDLSARLGQVQHALSNLPAPEPCRFAKKSSK